jgi:chemotaxis protein MotB
MDGEHNDPVRIVVKKSRDHGGHHGGAWKVAYADFVTAMMALFIVLWILGQSTDVKEAIAAYFKDPGAFTSTRSGGVLQGSPKPLLFTPPVASPPAPDKRSGDLERLKAEAKSIQEKIASVPDFSKFKEKIEVMVTPEGLRIDLVEVSEGLFFDIGKAKLKPEAVRLLKLIASRLATLPNKIVVEGYTDARPYVSSGYSNWDLSVDRANSARGVLEESGLAKDQIREVRGFADRKLRVPERPFDYANRRVSILVAAGGAGPVLHDAPRAQSGRFAPSGGMPPQKQGK